MGMLYELDKTERAAVLPAEARGVSPLGDAPAAHTPTPWMIDEDAPMDIACSDKTRRYLIGTTFDHEEITSEEAKANASLIVQAVNAHRALIEALQGLMVRFEKSGEAWMSEPAMMAARAALQIAEVQRHE